MARGTSLAEQADPKYGGILAAVPITTTLAILFTYSEAGQVTARQLVLDAFWFVIPTLLFLLALYLLMSRYPLLPHLGWAWGIWITAVLVVNRVFTWGGDPQKRGAPLPEGLTGPGKPVCAPGNQYFEA